VKETALDLKDLLKNPGTVPFSRLRFLQRFASDEQAAEFIEGLFTETAEARYSGDWERLNDFLDRWEQTATDLLFEKIWIPKLEDVPWATLSTPLSQSKFALVTTGGVFMEDGQPFSERGDATFREIPSDVTQDHLRIWHQGYDNGPANQDINCIFPIDRFRELQREGVIGSLAETYYSFMGLLPDARPLIAETAPEVARRLKSAGVDAVFLAST
jgi:D-proline reductase (dithiol) PrdB